MDGNDSRKPNLGDISFSESDWSMLPGSRVEASNLEILRYSDSAIQLGLFSDCSPLIESIRGFVSRIDKITWLRPLVYRRGEFARMRATRCAWH